MRELLAYSQGGVVEEKLTLRIKADNSGNIYLPTGGLSPEGTQDCPYDWMVSVDGGNAVEYKGTGSSNGSIRVGYGLNPLSVHTIIVKPKVEEYLWLRAFAYKGASIASSLVNIISDKSYKGYAISDMYSGDYYKAYQYQGCTSLVNTDEELLPDTLLVIGDYYRYYEYAGCTSLVSNAEEKILKTVRVIGDNYRAYQYQNCTGINKVNMRAINWASVGNNYRLNQYSGIGTDKNPATIYIEGGIEEGGSWGLSNDNVKSIYVYEGLVSDYRTKLSSITSSKIQKNAEWDNYEYEFIEYTALADSSGKIRIPVGGYSTSGTQNCAYDWYVSIDGGEPTEITGTGSATYVSVGSGLTSGSEHRVVIKPATIGWGWGRAFGFYNTGAQAYIKEIIHDSYKCYASSRTSTGAHYKHGTYKGCTNIINSYEKLPTSVTSIGDHYMSECYEQCTSLSTAFWEVLHKSCTVGSNYRYHQYKGCTAMSTFQGMAGYSGTYPTNYKLDYLSGAGTNLNIYITRYEKLPDTILAQIAQVGYTENYPVATITQNGTYRFKCDIYESGGSGSTVCYVYKNGTEIGSQSSVDYSTIQYVLDFEANANDVITMSVVRFSYGAGNCKNIVLSKAYNSAGIEENRVNGIYCYIEDYDKYENNFNWDNLVSKLKIWYYNYKCYDFIDINRYTRLLSTVTLPGINNDYTLYYYGGRGFSINQSMSRVSVTGRGGHYVGIINLNPSWSNGILTGLTYSSQSVWGGNPSSGGGNTEYVAGLAFSKNGTLYGHYDYNGRNYDYYGEKNIGERMGRGAPEVGGAISRHGKYLWGYYGGFKRWLSASKNVWDSNSTYISPTSVELAYGNLVFSDDGMTMVGGNADRTLLTQYNLSKPRDIDTAVSTGKTLSMEGAIYFSNDFKYMFVHRYDSTDNQYKIYQYTYE